MSRDYERNGVVLPDDLTVTRRLRARLLSNQTAGASVALNYLNGIAKLGMPISIRIK